jgi:hypothetical protein
MHLAQLYCTVGNISGIAFSVVDTFFLDAFNVMKSSSLSGRLYSWKEPEVIHSQMRGTRYMLHFSN